MIRSSASGYFMANSFHLFPSQAMTVTSMPACMRLIKPMLNWIGSGCLASQRSACNLQCDTCSRFKSDCSDSQLRCTDFTNGHIQLPSSDFLRLGERHYFFFMSVIICTLIREKPTHIYKDEIGPLERIKYNITKRKRKEIKPSTRVRACLSQTQTKTSNSDRHSEPARHPNYSSTIR